VVFMPSEYVSAAGTGADSINSYDVPADAKQFDLPPIEAVPAKTVAGRIVDQDGRPLAKAHISLHEGDRSYGGGKSDSEGRFVLSSVPESIDPAKVKYGWTPENGSTMPTDCEILQTDPLVLRALPRDPAQDRP